MSDYIVYRPSGEIVSTLTCPTMDHAQEMVDRLPAYSGCALMVTDSDASDFYVGPNGDLVAFPARPDDTATWDWDALHWVPTPASVLIDRVWSDLRAERDRRITLFQWRVQRSNDEIELGLTPTEDRAALLTYVQALRDLPETTTDPTAPVWPVMPEEA